MKHTSKRLLSILLCLVLMLSLVPAAYADAEVNYTKAQAQKLAAEMRILALEQSDLFAAETLNKSANDLEMKFTNPDISQKTRNEAFEEALKEFRDNGGDPDKLVIAPETPDKIDLYPVVLQANRLYNRYGEFYGKSVISSLVNGFSAAFPRLVGNVDWSDFKTAWGKLETDNPFPVLSGLNPSIAKVWNTIGQNFVGTENSTAGDGSVVGAIAALEAGITLPAIS